MRALRFLRGMLGVALTWGFMWAVAGGTLGTIIAALKFETGPNLPLLQAETLRAATVFGIIGFLNGIGFSVALAASERRRSFGELSLSRVALWGVIGGLSYPAFFALSNFVDGYRLPSDFLVAIPLCALFGAFSAWSILSIARRAKDGARTELGAGTAPEFAANARDRATADAK